MSHMTDRNPRDPAPFIAYAMYFIVAICLAAGAAIMWGVTQDQNWHGFGGVVRLVGLS